MERNMNKIIDEVKLDDRYCMNTKEADLLASEIKSMGDIYVAIFKAFKYGYALGIRAAKANKK
ncbi:hypothetical protein [Butyrivibrio sp. WCD2001]|uniref:hypothetical protein n=1 Tax=Butyrivibrio sp. WCD2001 TaxID=1280681 RepID=UPI000428B1BF|nr:hypothetical protein [Butyrivibrio sp. WCD2001]